MKTSSNESGQPPGLVSKAESQMGGQPDSSQRKSGAHWTAEELELLGTVPDVEAARNLGRSLHAVQHKRSALGRRNPGKNKTHWREDELKLLGRISDDQAAQLTNRPVPA